MKCKIQHPVISQQQYVKQQVKMYQPETIDQYDNYIENRLSKIQSYIFDNKIKEQQNLFTFVQVTDYQQSMGKLWDKVKWIQINVKDYDIWMSKVQEKIESVNVIVDKVGFIWRKVGNVDGKMIELEEAVKIMSNKQWQKSIHIQQMTNLKDQIAKYEKEIGQLKQKIIEVEYKNRSAPTFNLPHQIVVTKKQLRQSIEQLQKIYDKKMEKIEKDVKKLKKQKSNKKIIKMIETNHDDYDLENIMHRKSEDSISSNLKPLILDAYSNTPTHKSTTEHKIQGFHRRSQKQKQSYLSANARQSSNSRRHGDSNNQTRKKSRKKQASKSRKK